MNSHRNIDRRRILTGCGLFGGLLLTAACGFRPVHAPVGDNGVTPGQELAAIQIRPIEGRVGQTMHNKLRDRLNPAGQPDKPKYRLLVSLSQTNREESIQEDETASRINVTMVANYSLLASGDNTELLRGAAQSVNAFDVLNIDVYYSTTVSEQDAIDRSLTQLANDIQLRLAAYFGNPDRAAAS